MSALAIALAALTIVGAAWFLMALLTAAGRGSRADERFERRYQPDGEEGHEQR